MLVDKAQACQADGSVINGLDLRFELKKRELTTSNNAGTTLPSTSTALTPALP